MKGMDGDESRGLLKTVLGYLGRKPQEKPPPKTSLRSKALDAFLRTDAYLQHETDDFDEIDLEEVARALRTFENLVRYDFAGSLRPEQSSQGSPHAMQYPKLQALRNMAQRSNNGTYISSNGNVRVSKRKRENDAAIEELSNLATDAKKRRVIARDEPDVSDRIEEPEADKAILMRRHSLSLHYGLRRHWICTCQKCSGMSVRLSLPQQKKGSKNESCFEVFFGVRSLLATELQEAKIIVKDMFADYPKSASYPVPHVWQDVTPLCQSITEALGQRNCLSLSFEDGMFRRLRPQLKNFADVQVPRTVSLSALFTRQQELCGGSSALPLKGKRVLAFTLATALLPFLETPWVQPSFNHSKIQFFQPLRDGELPDITKPFLSMEHIPIVSANKEGRNGQESDNTKHMVHPNASVLALGILLCELQYCTPVELLRTDTEAPRNINTDFYTSLDVLKNLEADAGSDYYLATKACLQWEYLPSGEPADFESVSVQRLFYQNVIKRLEGEIFKSWKLRPEDLVSLNSPENELCWGKVGKDVVRELTSKAEISTTGQRARSLPLPSDTTSQGHAYSDSGMALPISRQPSPAGFARTHLEESSEKGLYLFDGSHQTVSGPNSALSQSWMNNLLASIDTHVDSFDAIEVATGPLRPVRIAILDSGFDPSNPLLRTNEGQIDPRIKDARSFVHQTNPHQFHDEMGHGTHALGLLLKVATCAEIYVAKVAGRETIDRDSYDDIAKAINHAVTEWNVDIISMSFGIREVNEPMKFAIINALHSQTLMFAAASNDGANLGRAFPAKYPSVFCIHATDGNGNPSTFNPTADDKDVNFSLLGEQVESHWPAGKGGHDQSVNVMSGTSVATPIAAGLAASLLSFVRQQEQCLAVGVESLSQWLKDVHAMDAVLKNMVRGTRGAGYDYITPHLLLDTAVPREHVYNKIKDIRRHMYD